MTRPALGTLALLFAGAACGPTNEIIRTPGCVLSAHVPTHVVLTLGRTAAVPQTCPRMLEGSIRGPVRLTALREGLHVQFGVVVAVYSPGPYRDEGAERDAVVVFPAETGPGQPSHQLSTAPAPGGYIVDDVLPWSVWNLDGPDGAFRFTVAVFDNYEGNARVESRVTVTVVVRPPTS